MIKTILHLLENGKYYGFSENIEIAKGKYEIAKNNKQAYEQSKKIAHGN